MTLTERFIEARHWPPARKTAYISGVLLPAPLWAWMGARATHAWGGPDGNPVVQALQWLTGVWFFAGFLVFVVAVVAAMTGEAAS